MGTDLEGDRCSDERLAHSDTSSLGRHMRRITIDEISEFSKTRDVELCARRAPPPYVLALHGEFDGYGDFFSIHIADIEFLEIEGRFSVEAAFEIHDLKMAETFSGRWKQLRGQYSPPAVVFVEKIDSPSAPRQFIVVANQIDCFAGDDWR